VTRKSGPTLALLSLSKSWPDVWPYEHTAKHETSLIWPYAWADSPCGPTHTPIEGGAGYGQIDFVGSEVSEATPGAAARNSADGHTPRSRPGQLDVPRRPRAQLLRLRKSQLRPCSKLVPFIGTRPSCPNRQVRDPSAPTGSSARTQPGSSARNRHNWQQFQRLTIGTPSGYACAGLPGPQPSDDEPMTIHRPTGQASTCLRDCSAPY